MNDKVVLLVDAHPRDKGANLELFFMGYRPLVLGKASDDGLTNSGVFSRFVEQKRLELLWDATVTLFE